jgi:hypothetical protein
MSFRIHSISRAYRTLVQILIPGRNAKQMFGVANFERQFIRTNAAGSAMHPVRLDRSMRQLTEGIADSDSDSDVVERHLALAPLPGHVG